MGLHPVIGLTGLAGSGKDTVADHLVRNHGFVKTAFAKPLKDMLRKLDPIIGFGMETGAPSYPARLSLAQASLTELQIKETFPEYRRLLQVLGTDCIRALDEDFWIKAAAKEIGELRKRQPVVVTDVRFPNEADLIRASNWGEGITKSMAEGHVWSVQRTFDYTPSETHPSEQWAGRMGEGWTLKNDGDLDHLYFLVDQTLEWTEKGALK